MKAIHLFTVAFFCVLCSGTSYAQMVGTDVFLKGRFVELGITQHGSYGASSSPAGYHPHLGGGTSTALGFVADPDMDGWTVGTPAYMGDYFYPGTPFEGWDLQVGTMRHQEFNMTTTTLGSNTAYATVGSKVTGTWNGMFDSVNVTQVTSLDTNALYFTIKVTLTNLSVLPKDDLYYLRTLDPDNDQSWPGGSFTTKNKIEYQATDTTVVSATGLSASAPYLALGASDTAATCFIYTSWPIATSVDIGGCYNTTLTSGYTYSVGSIVTSDDAIGLIKYIPHLATVDSAADSVLRTTSAGLKHPANSASFYFFYAFSPAARDSAIREIRTLSTAPHTTDTVVTTPTVINNVNTQNTISVYPNPAKEIVNIAGLNQTDKVALYDMTGRLITVQTARNATSTMSLHGISKGVYTIVVTDTHSVVKYRGAVRKQKHCITIPNSEIPVRCSPGFLF